VKVSETFIITSSREESEFLLFKLASAFESGAFSEFC
jgi:hypothetical protein